jgi:hypothetical protein
VNYIDKRQRERLQSPYIAKQYQANGTATPPSVLNHTTVTGYAPVIPTMHSTVECPIDRLPFRSDITQNLIPNLVVAESLVGLKIFCKYPDTVLHKHAYTIDMDVKRILIQTM